MLGGVVVPGAAARALTEEERADQAPAVVRAGGEEGLGEEELTPEERVAMEASAVSKVGGASKEGNDPFEYYKEPWKCASPVKCKGRQAKARGS